MEREIDLPKRGRPRGSKNIYPSDTQRDRIYKAERLMPEFKHRDFQTPREIEKFVLAFMKRKAWTNRCACNRLRLLTSNRENATCFRWGSNVELNLPIWAWSKLIVAHELAHAMCWAVSRGYGRKATAKHSREFAGTYLYLVGKICGEDVKIRLKQEFFKLDVDWDSNLAS